MEAQEVIARLEEALHGVVDFSGEMMLLDWNKSSAKDGPKVKFLLTDDDAIAPFESATLRKGKQAGQIYHIFAIRVDEDSARMLAGRREPKRDPNTIDLLDGQTDRERREANDLARDLMVRGYFRNPQLWAALERAGIYTAEQHKQWVQSQPCVGPRLADKLPGCMGEVCAHHVAKAELPAAGPESSNPRKPPHWYTIPLCVKHHQVWAHGSSAVSATREDRERMLVKAVELTAGQVKEAVKRAIGIESLAQITRQQLAEFERRIGL